MQKVTESKGAALAVRRYLPDRFARQWIPISARAATARSLRTSTRADAGEAYAYNAALAKGEIGIQRPIGANAPGPDFITAVKDQHGHVREVLISDVKTSERGKAPTLRRRVPRAWRAEVQQAVAPGRLDTGDPKLDEEIRQAVAEGRIRLRQLEIDMSPTPQGQGRITEARRLGQILPRRPGGLAEVITLASGSASPGARSAASPFGYGIPPFAILDRFGYNNARLQPHHCSAIDRIASYVIAAERSSKPVRTIVLIGHTDAVGSHDFNCRLGLRRALSVAVALRYALLKESGCQRPQDIPIRFETQGEAEAKGDLLPEHQRRVEVFLFPEPQPPQYKGTKCPNSNSLFRCMVG
jgi:hypothetical protein